MHLTDHKCAEILLRSGPLTAGDLAQRTGLTTGAITGVIDRLEKAGFVRRGKDPGDRRRVIIKPFAGKIEKVIAPLFGSVAQMVSDLCRPLQLPGNHRRPRPHRSLQSRRFRGDPEVARRGRAGKACPQLAPVIVDHKPFHTLEVRPPGGALHRTAALLRGASSVAARQVPSRPIRKSLPALNLRHESPKQASPARSLR